MIIVKFLLKKNKLFHGYAGGDAVIQDALGLNKTNPAQSFLTGAGLKIF